LNRAFYTILLAQFMSALADNALLLGFYSRQQTIDRPVVEAAAHDRITSLGKGEHRERR